MGHVDRKSLIKPFTWQPVANSYLLGKHVAVLGQACLWQSDSLLGFLTPVMKVGVFLTSKMFQSCLHSPALDYSAVSES